MLSKYLDIVLSLLYQILLFTIFIRGSIATGSRFGVDVSTKRAKHVSDVFQACFVSLLDRILAGLTHFLTTLPMIPVGPIGGFRISSTGFVKAYPSFFVECRFGIYCVLFHRSKLLHLWVFVFYNIGWILSSLLMPVHCRFLIFPKSVLNIICLPLLKLTL